MAVNRVWGCSLRTRSVYVAINPRQLGYKCYCAKGKVIGSVVAVAVVIVCRKHKKSPNLEKQRWNATKQSKVMKNYLSFASNCLRRSTSTTNCAFSPATPINVLVPLRMLEIKTGSGRRVIKSLLVYCMHYFIHIYTGHEAIPLLQQQCHHGGRGMCSRELLFIPSDWSTVWRTQCRP